MLILGSMEHGVRAHIYYFLPSIAFKRATSIPLLGLFRRYDLVAPPSTTPLSVLSSVEADLVFNFAAFFGTVACK